MYGHKPNLIAAPTETRNTSSPNLVQILFYLQSAVFWTEKSVGNIREEFVHRLAVLVSGDPEN
jgi:hypothetical protein